MKENFTWVFLIDNLYNEIFGEYPKKTVLH